MTKFNIISHLSKLALIKCQSQSLEVDSTLEKMGVETIGMKERFLWQLMAIKPVVNGRQSSLARFFPNLIFDNSFNVSIAKIKPSLKCFGEGGGGCKYLQQSKFFSVIGMRYYPSSHREKITLIIGNLSNLRTVDITFFFSQKPPALLVVTTKERSTDHHSRIMTGCLQEKKQSNLATKKRAFTIQSRYKSKK